MRRPRLCPCQRRLGALALWGYTAGVIAGYAIIARRTLAPGHPLASAPEPAPGGEVWPLVSIVLPARDEARNIRACVESLLAQDYPAFELIVVDDASSDATPRVLEEIARTHARAGRMRVVRLDSLPPGWAGKPHALDAGATRARGEWLLFTDADTRHEPAALRTAVSQARAGGADLFSLLTAQELPDFWGRVIMPIAFMGISSLYPERAVNDPRSEVAIANGQYLLIRRAVYEVIGGYANPELRGTVVDDRDLARQVKRRGYRLVVADGRALVRTQMYHGLREHWRGWSKNAYAGNPGGPLLFAFLTAALPIGAIAPYVLLPVGLVARRREWVLAGAIQVGTMAAYRTALNRQLGIPWRYVWTHPLGAAVFTGILGRAAWGKLTGRTVAWRGRSYRV